MKKNIILEEINRIHLMMNYDNKKTLSENYSLLNEDNPGSVIRDLLSLDRDVLSALKAEESTIFKNMTNRSIVTTTNQELRTIDDVLKAMKEERITSTEAGKFYWSVYKNTSIPKVKDAAAEYIASREGVQTLTKNKSMREIQDFLLKKYKTLKPADAKKLAEKITEFRLSSEESKTAEELRKSEEIKNAENLGNTNTNNVNVNNTPEINIKIDNLTNPNWAKTSEREASVALERESDVVLNREQTKTVEETLEREREVLEEMRDKKPKTLLERLRNLGIVKWTGKIITNKWLWLLAGGSLAAYLLWYKFFKNQGINVTCSEGEKLDPQTGKCVKVGGGSTDDNQGEITYTVCSGTYHKGCKDATYSSEIKRLQRCLGLTATGNFDSETESAAIGVVNKKELNSSDIDRICGVI